ncbi:hypothetical protein BJY16_005239 [Actinoplanes octamycinicus]|uniref:Uncharacterized protein n=1 Tax=Actinoplanes octamycinicus TaxID=135948 RepID=A0A7W7M9G0_9ACTN|nr:hypothetical protein [Actinoplanes octamycinicus]MBB4741780.1 hypothetical protein [Actinoplanes octamycinicus]GIE57338.1 hypothetical protein Aoc01nite_27400 [Actinoplanes octamycinicus]
MSVASPNRPSPRRAFVEGVKLYIGPVLLLTLLAGLGFASKRVDPDKAGCHADLDAIAAIRAEPVFRQHPKSTDLDEPTESLSCGTVSSAADDGFPLLAAGQVSAHLTGSPAGVDVPGFYADLAERSGWRPSPRPGGLYSATKPAGGCSWWFVLQPADRGYQLTVRYQPAGLRDETCAWEDGDAVLIPLVPKN